MDPWWSFVRSEFTPAERPLRLRISEPNAASGFPQLARTTARSTISRLMDAVARQLVVFKLADRCYALQLSAVKRVLQIAEITPLPKSPEIVLGIVNLQGRIAPVFDLRRRFGLPHRPIDLRDHLIVARTRRRVVALVADAVVGVVQRLQTEITVPDQVLDNLQYLEGVAKLDDGLIMIHDLDAFLSPAEERTLEQAMASV